MKRKEKIHCALLGLADRFEYGQLSAETQPAEFLDQVTREIDRLRARVRELETWQTEVRISHKIGETSIASAIAIADAGLSKGDPQTEPLQVDGNPYPNRDAL